MMNMRFLLTVIVLLQFSVFESAWSAEINKDYRLGAGDVIKISVYEYPDLTTEIRVSETGNVSFPLLGEVSVGGKTVAEAERLITKQLNDGDFIKQPQVTLVVTQFVSQKVNVLGLVNKPGIYSLEVSSHVIDLLAQAGGVTEVPPAADFATLLHSNGSKVTIDLHALLAGDRTQNHTVTNGDVIVVPRAPMFYIYGEVQRPGSYKLEKNMSIAQAISAGGGLTAKGSESWPGPVVKRRDAGGKEQEIDADGLSLLQADDVLYIKESWL
jgi:polysaccharide export outer membrane protein